ncbi:tetratricopeptide repeat protein [Flectobacillus longus]|uniref:tetratricopeptide repeat protein n=1 Tax=Flectobacillus longus TaxID=2984207 RepID=UPI0024B65BC4|nr:hypothetical protein [Flectobacillus longus]MDI9879539.1 hypothetical protein [Flectobacillus longus]
MSDKLHIRFWVILSCVLLLGVQSGISQITKDSLFLQHLIGKEQYHDAITFTNQLEQKYPISIQSKLQLAYQKGFAFYSLKQLDSASVYFSKVSSESPYFSQSQFWAGLSDSYLRDFTKAEKYFKAIDSKDSLNRSLQTFELAGLALLQRNQQRFDSLQRHLDPSLYALQKQQANYLLYRDDILKQQKKSGFKAGLLSAIIPGAGKIYAGGQLGQGISAFLQNTILGLQAYEGLRKDGVGSPRFIIYGSLFSLFYIGNIWGSALSVKIKRQEFNEKIDEQILFDMHIPLRTLFN